MGKGRNSQLFDNPSINYSAKNRHSYIQYLETSSLTLLSHSMFFYLHLRMYLLLYDFTCNPFELTKYQVKCKMLLEAWSVVLKGEKIRKQDPYNV